MSEVALTTRMGASAIQRWETDRDAASSKPIGVSFHEAAHVAPVIELFDLALERDGGRCAAANCSARMDLPPASA